MTTTSTSERLLASLRELRHILDQTRSEDLRAQVLLAVRDVEARLAAARAQDGETSRTVDAAT
jgi:type VI protein secretion system component VasF